MREAHESHGRRACGRSRPTAFRPLVRPAQRAGGADGAQRLTPGPADASRGRVPWALPCRSPRTTSPTSTSTRSSASSTASAASTSSSARRPRRASTASPSRITARSTARSPSTRRASTAAIKPIIGVETYVARRSMADREGKADAQPFHLILLAKDWTGYQNLCRIVTDAHVDGYYYKPRIDRELPRPAQRGPHRALGLPERRDRPRARDRRLGRGAAARRQLRGHLRAGQLLPRGPGPRPARAARAQREARCGSAPRSGSRSSPRTTCTTSTAPSREAHDVLLCVGTGSNLDTPGRMRFETSDFYLKTAAEMAALFGELPEAISNTRRISEMTDLKLTFGQLRLPDFPVPHGHTVESWLRAECERGLARALRRADRRAHRRASTTSSASSSRWATRATS